MRPHESSPASSAGLPPFVRSHPEGVLLHLKVQPRASRDGLDGVLGQELKIRVTAPPVDSAANQAVIELLAGHLDCPKSALAILRGQTGRHKVVLVRGLATSQVWVKLKAAL